jgi:hypothetical protein
VAQLFVGLLQLADPLLQLLDLVAEPHDLIDVLVLLEFVLVLHLRDVESVGLLLLHDLAQDHAEAVALQLQHVQGAQLALVQRLQVLLLADERFEGLVAFLPEVLVVSS